VAPGLLRPSADEALASWRALVVAHREQIERLREDRREGDFWAPRAQQFRPGTRESVEIPYLESLGSAREEWLDVGAGGGRFAIPLAQRFARVVAVEPSPSMRQALAAAADERGVHNIDVVGLAWPPAPDVPLLSADLSLVSHVLYDIDDPGAFVVALERATRRRCAVILGDRAPSTAFEPLWTELWGEPLHRLPALREFLVVLGAMGRRFDVRSFPAGREEALDAQEAHAGARRLYWVAPGSERDARLGRLLREHYGTPSGQVTIPARINHTAVVTWEPPRLPGGARA